MNIKCGNDLIGINRIEKAIKKSGKPLLDRIWTEREQSFCRSSAGLAGRFAAKEAIAKALGSGIGPKGVRWTDIEILRKENGAPEAFLHAAAADLYKEIGGISLSISLSHDMDLAQAFCVILCD